MASVSWSKNRKNELTKNLAHASRHDNREDVNYKNRELDKTLYARNYSIGGDWNKWRDEAAKLKARVEELDKVHPPKRIRKDRVTSVSYVITLPSDLVDSGKEKEFFEMAYAELAEFSGGKENLSVGYVHADEVHSYFDKTKHSMEQSRQHMHVAGVPWTDEFGVNAKNFQTRKRMKELNDRINQKCLELFRVPFYDWSEARVFRKDGRDLEALKRESLNALEDEKVRVLQEINHSRRELAEVRGKIGEEKDNLSETSQELADKQENLIWYRRVENENKRLRKRVTVFERVFSFLKEKGVMKSLFDLFTKHGRDDLRRELNQELNPAKDRGFER